MICLLFDCACTSIRCVCYPHPPPPQGVKQTAGAGAGTELGSWRQHCRHLPPGSSTSPVQLALRPSWARKWHTSPTTPPTLYLPLTNTHTHRHTYTHFTLFNKQENIINSFWKKYVVYCCMWKHWWLGGASFAVRLSHMLDHCFNIQGDSLHDKKCVSCEQWLYFESCDVNSCPFIM